MLCRFFLFFIPMALLIAQLLSNAPPQPRTILALYDSSESGDLESDQTTIHRSAELILNHLGMKVLYHDMAQGLPPSTVSNEAFGILTWFDTDAMDQAASYCQWACKQIDQGKKMVILGCLGALRDRQTGTEVPIDTVNQMLLPLGLTLEGDRTDSPCLLSI